MRDTRTNILDVAEDLVQRVGLNAMSYQDISAAVGIRKASIHHHFPKKEDLVNELLARCRTTYGNNYRRIVEGRGRAPEKLREIAAIFGQGLTNKKLCLVGSISTNQNTLKEHSRAILEGTIKDTVDIYTQVFQQGREEGSLNFKGSPEEAAYGYFSFLVGTQIVARSHGGVDWFHRAAESVISCWET